jgi:hypothetical protein
MARRLIVTAGWLAAAILAVLVGLLAISVIGDGITAPSARPMSEDDVARELTGVPPPSTSPSASASPSASVSLGTAPPAATRTFTTRAGTVVGRCAGGRPEIISMSPAQGFTVHERDAGPQGAEAEGEFRGSADDHNRLKVDVACAGGRPELRIDRDEDRQ